jgi:hypothetical protein
MSLFAIACQLWVKRKGVATSRELVTNARWKSEWITEHVFRYPSSQTREGGKDIPLDQDSILSAPEGLKSMEPYGLLA